MVKAWPRVRRSAFQKVSVKSRSAHRGGLGGNYAVLNRDLADIRPFGRVKPAGTQAF